MSEANKALLRRFWEEVWNGRGATPAGEFFAENCRLHIGGAEVTGDESLWTALANQWFEPFPDLTVTLEQQIAEGDRVAELIVFRGTHSGGPFLPGLFQARGLPAIPPSGASFEFTQTWICRFEDGRIAEVWEDFDRVRLFLQLGVGLVVPSKD
jgi:predicted ester cyclase